MAKRSDLTLYYTPLSFYSQKGLLILHEKKLPFKKHDIDLCGGETYSPWFMEMNPKGKIPVLKDGDTVITESSEIAAYLDKTYGGKPLLPSPSSDFGQRVAHFSQLLDGLNVPVLTFGGMLFPDVIHKSHLVGFVIRAGQKRVLENEYLMTLEAAMKKNPSMKDIYEPKRKAIIPFVESLRDKDRVLVERSKARDILHEIEKELSKTQQENPGKETWLCGEDFTLADISLCILLHRLYLVGYSGAMWENNLLPKLDAYFAKLKTRQSYKDVMGKLTSPCFVLGLAVGHYKAYIGIGGLAAVGMGVGCYLYWRKK
eukprot:GHVO01049668.1.p1 GENE.GHVO01049668.1~~GHVO01049668.1.p1  ORF type:complete len:342 (+),score=35.18 GHVO01049668.1:85-1026(+)